MKEGIDYKLIEFNQAEDSIDDQWTVEFLSGDFKGIKIQYGTIRIDEETDVMAFDYEIVEKTDPDVKEDNPELVEAVKAILSNVLTDALEWMEKEALSSLEEQKRQES